MKEPRLLWTETDIIQASSFEKPITDKSGILYIDDDNIVWGIGCRVSSFFPGYKTILYIPEISLCKYYITYGAINVGNIYILILIHTVHVMNPTVGKCIGLFSTYIEGTICRNFTIIAPERIDIGCMIFSMR